MIVKIVTVFFSFLWLKKGEGKKEEKQGRKRKAGRRER